MAEAAAAVGADDGGEVLRSEVERLVIKEHAGDDKRTPQGHAAAAAGATASISSPAAASSGDSSMVGRT